MPLQTEVAIANVAADAHVTESAVPLFCDVAAGPLGDVYADIDVAVEAFVAADAYVAVDADVAVDKSKYEKQVLHL